MIPCQVCNRHYRVTETSCPHCAAGPMLIRNLKMGTLMAFTAATTAACYGSVPPPGSLPNARPTNVPVLDQPAERVPANINTAYYFITPTDGGGTGKDVLPMTRATIVDKRLTLASSRNDFIATIELPDPNVLSTFTTITLDNVRFLYVKGQYFQEKDGGPAGDFVDLIMALPGEEKIQGTLEMQPAGAKVLLGKLTLTSPKGKIVLYFNVER